MFLRLLILEWLLRIIDLRWFLRWLLRIIDLR
jgi:hypothetical protein